MALLEKEISIRETALYLTAKEVDADFELQKEMALWDKACSGDGLETEKDSDLDQEEKDILIAFEEGKLEPIPNSKTEVTRLTRIFKAAENKTSR